MNNNDVPVEFAGESLLAHGCTERQMVAMESILDTVEKELTSLHMLIVGLRAVAYCGPEARATFEKCADTAAWSSRQLLQEFRKQHDSVAGLIGKKIERPQQ